MTENLDLAGLAAWADARVPGALFWTVSGAHLYGFPSADSDVDLRGCFLAPLRDVVGLKSPTETCEPKGDFRGREVEAVAHEVGKYLRLLLRHNGYVLEQVFSPLVAAGGEFLSALRPLAARCVTRNCYHHYRGFLRTQRKFLDDRPTVKALLYAYRVVLTGIHLLETGEVVAHLPTLNDRFRLPFIPDLIAEKTAAEVREVRGWDPATHRGHLDRLEGELGHAYAGSKLPETGPTEELNRFLVALRLGRSGEPVTS